MNLTESIRWFVKGTSPGAQRTRSAVKIILLLGLFFALFWVIPVKSVLQALVTADLKDVVISVLLAYLVVLFTSCQMVPLLRQLYIQHNLGQIIEINLVVKFYALFTPGTIVPTGIKWFRFSQPDGKVAESFVALAFFRILEIFISVSLGFTFWILSTGKSVQISRGWLLALIAAIILLWLLITRFSWPVYSWGKSRLASQSKRTFWDRVFQRTDKLFQAVSAYAEMPLYSLSAALIFGISAHLIGILADLIMARSLGIEISYLDMGWIYAVLYIASTMPFAVAGGLGIRELTLVAILPTFDVKPEIALAFSILIFARMALISISGGMFELFRTLQNRH